MPKAYAAKAGTLTGWPIGYPYGLIDLGFPDWPEGWAFPGPPWPPGWDDDLWDDYLYYKSRFQPLSQTSRAWYGLTIDSNNNVFACVYYGGIYKQTEGSGNFITMGQTTRAWMGIVANSDGVIQKVYASANSAGDFVQSGGMGNFEVFGFPLSSGFTSMCINPANGDQYVISNGKIYQQSGGVNSDWTLVGSLSGGYTFMRLQADSNNNIYAEYSYGGDSNYGYYKQSGGSGAFTLVNAWDEGGYAWNYRAYCWYLTVTPSGDVYAASGYGYNNDRNVIRKQITVDAHFEFQTVSFDNIPTTPPLCSHGISMVYSSEKKQMTQLASDLSGNIYTYGTLAYWYTETHGHYMQASVAYTGIWKKNSGSSTFSLFQEITITSTEGKRMFCGDDGLMYILTWAGKYYKQSSVGGTFDLYTTGLLANYYTQDGTNYDGYLYLCSSGDATTNDIYKKIGDDYIAQGWAKIGKSLGKGLLLSNYGCGDGQIYKQTLGVGNFLSQNQTSKNYYGITVNPLNGDVYVCVYNGNIYKQTAGTGFYVALGQTTRNWSGIVADGNGDIWACVYGGNIYKQTNGHESDGFITTNQTTRNWKCIAADSHRVYAAVYFGDIYYIDLI